MVRHYEDVYVAYQNIKTGDMGRTRANGLSAVQEVTRRQSAFLGMDNFYLFIKITMEMEISTSQKEKVLITVN